MWLHCFYVCETKTTILDITLETIPVNVAKLIGTLSYQHFIAPSPLFKVETTFGNLPRHKLNIELGEQGFKKRNMEFNIRGMRICIEEKVVSTSYVKDCSSNSICEKASRFHLDWAWYYTQIINLCHLFSLTRLYAKMRWWDLRQNDPWMLLVSTVWPKQSILLQRWRTEQDCRAKRLLRNK